MNYLLRFRKTLIGLSNHAIRVRRMLQVTFIAAAVACSLVSTPVSAGTATASMGVSATVLGVCLVSTTNLAFGNYTASSGTPLATTATITSTCTSGTSGTLTLDAGTNAGGATNFSARGMKLATNTLAYQVYTDAAHTQVWGDGVNGGSRSVAISGTGLPINTTAYGIISTGQYVPAGAYSDTVTVTISF